MAYDTNMKQHQNMARGNGTMSGGNHGCQSLSEANGGHEHPDRNNAHTPLADGSRSGPPHISRGGGSMAATAHSDHGPHQLPR